MNIFQTVILGIFAFFLVLAVLIFSGIIPIFDGAPSGVGGTVTLWGTLPQEFLNESLKTFNEENRKVFTVHYIEKNRHTFDQELLEAIASGRGPDMVLLSQDLIVRHGDKVTPLPYENYSLRDFRDTFIEEGELYLTGNGILALPFAIDPMIMYWNRDLFSSASIAQPPRLWDEFLTLSPLLTLKDEALNIRRSTVAFGEYENVLHVKDILAMLIIQAGNPLIEVGERELEVVLDERRGLVTPPAQSALRFYTEFSNPVKPIYSWNRSLPNSKDFFVAGDLAVYFGYASEYRELQAKSPQLNFDLALVPQPRDAKAKSTFGRMLGIGVLKSSNNIPTAFFISFALTSKEFIHAFSRESGLPPVRRDLLKDKPVDVFGEIFYTSALISKAWLDPLPQATSVIFRDMVENVVSGRTRVSEAVSRAHSELNRLISPR